MGLITGEGGVVSYTVHPSAGALDTQSILHGVDTALVLEGGARSALEDSVEARHDFAKDHERR